MKSPDKCHTPTMVHLATVLCSFKGIDFFDAFSTPWTIIALKLRQNFFATQIKPYVGTHIHGTF